MGVKTRAEPSGDGPWRSHQISEIVTAVLTEPLLPAERVGGRDYVGVPLGIVGIAAVIRPNPTSPLDPELIGKVLFFVGVVIGELGAVLI